MSSSDVVIRARGLGKRYALRRARQASTLGELISTRLRRPFQRESRDEFWALKDLDFDIRRGEVVGLIGRNGSGKSTLLKILSRITELTEGEVTLDGRIGSLLEVGTGFHQDLSGRENIFINGAMLGMTRREITRQFDGIVAFAGVEKFLDTPVKHYSSGMYVRLAFAVAAHLRSEILIVDEVLAVGDAEFQAKCLGKMRDISTDGRTVIFVSHNMHSIALLCSRGIVLDAGRLSFSGHPSAAIDTYTAQFSAPTSPVPSTQRPGTGEYRFAAVWTDKSVVSATESKRIAFTVERTRGRLDRFYPSAHLFDDRGQEIAHMDGRFVGCWLTDGDALAGELVINGPWLRPGRYTLDMYLCSESAVIDSFSQACTFEVTSALPYRHAAGSIAVPSGAVLADFEWQAIAGSTPSEHRPAMSAQR